MKPAIAQYKQLILTTNSLADEMTSHNVIEHNLTSSAQKLKERVENRKAVRSVLLQRAFTKAG